jgi:Isocitrate lyase family
VALRSVERLLLVGLYRLAPRVLDALKILRPETLLRWHRAGFRTYWRWKSRPRDGRPADIRRLIREMSVANPLWGVPTLVIARTDAESAKLITSDVDERDREFLTEERTAEGFHRLKPGTGLAHCIKRGLAFARYADLLWWETSKPDLADARRFAHALALCCCWR